jgi:hypothetical protein
VATSIAFYMMARKASTYLRESGVLESIETLGKGVANTAPFTPPAGGELTPDMVQRFVAVQDAMVGKLGPKVQQVKAIQDEMMRRQEAEHRNSTSAEDAKNVSSMMGLIVQAQGTWVDAVNQ